MAKTTKRQRSLLITALQGLTGVLFFIMGLEGLADNQGISMELGRAVSGMFGGDSDIYMVIIAVSELLSGAILIASLFAIIKTKIMQYALNTVIVLWGITILVLDILGQSFSSGGFDWMLWLEYTAIHLILLGVLLIIRSDRASERTGTGRSIEDLLSRCGEGDLRYPAGDLNRCRKGLLDHISPMPEQQGMDRLVEIVGQRDREVPAYDLLF